MRSKSSPCTSTSPNPTVKKEPADEEIKDYAETAMNELLGWYGYEGLELRRWAAARAGSPESSKRNSPDNKDNDMCSWCNNPIVKEALTQSGSRFCSELCFSQSRRANFKRAKTCDWCKHVRHTVAYVDFQDGASQLQFCSDKCLNQYKMHIFCRETQAHLDLNPHLQGNSSGSNLITPELWMKNCKSRSTSPASRTSQVSNPLQSPDEEKHVKLRETSPKPVITITPTAKLMKSKNEVKTNHDLKKEKIPKCLRKRRCSKSSTVTSQCLNKQAQKHKDNRLCSPTSNSDISTNTTISPPNQKHIPNLNPISQQPFYGLTPPQYRGNLLGDSASFNPLHAPNFIRPPAFANEPPRLPNILPNQPQLGQGPPPVTILMPYPVIVPIPLPIPIPIPMASFFRAYNLDKHDKPPAPCFNDDETPLDCTVNSHIEEPEERRQEPSGVDENKPEKVVDHEMEDTIEDHNPEKTLPKFKITRLGSKMAKIVQKPREMPESTRPLRKRRRLVEVTLDEDTQVMQKRKTAVHV